MNRKDTGVKILIVIQRRGNGGSKVEFIQFLHHCLENFEQIDFQSASDLSQPLKQQAYLTYRQRLTSSIKDLLDKSQEQCAANNLLDKSQLQEQSVKQVFLAYFRWLTAPMSSLLNISQAQTAEQQQIEYDYQLTSAQTDALKHLLTENWQLVRGTYLSYTAMPTDDTTLLLCSIAQYCAQYSEEETSALALLMTGIHLHPNMALADFMPNLPALETLPLATVLQTHLDIHQGQQLYPEQGLLVCLPLNITEPANLSCPYWNSEDTSEENLSRCHISEEDRQRLGRRSAFTRNYVDLYQERERLTKKSTSLYDQLVRLLKALYSSSERRFGTSTNAGGDIYTAIIIFSEQYYMLDGNSRKEIPDQLSKEIDLIIKLASDPSKNSDATQNLLTCTATRYNRLKPLVNTYRAILQEISTDETALNRQIAQSKQRLNRAAEKLRNIGYDEVYVEKENTLALNKALLTKLGINLTINSKNVNDILGLAVDELKDLLSDSNLKQQLSSAIGSLEKFVAYCHELNHEKLIILMQTILGETKQNYIKTSEDLAALLTSLSNEKTEIVLNSIKERIGSIVRNGDQLARTLKKLSRKQRFIVLNSIKDQLSHIIKNDNQFVEILKYLSNEQRSLLYTALKVHICQYIKPIYNALIKSTNSFGAFFSANYLFDNQQDAKKLVTNFYRYIAQRPHSLVEEALSIYQSTLTLQDNFRTRQNRAAGDDFKNNIRIMRAIHKSSCRHSGLFHQTYVQNIETMAAKDFRQAPAHSRRSKIYHALQQ